MNFDIVLAGVGGQGVLSMAAIIASSAVAEGLVVKQAETHGMSQRGGAVAAHLRLADHSIASDLVPHGSASMILSAEPLESLRYLFFLGEDGVVISSCHPLQNIADYPPIQQVLAAIRELPHSVLIDTEAIAREAGSVRAANVVLVGVASRFLPVSAKALERSIAARFQSKGDAIVAANLDAFRAARSLSD